ncbi:hypothetical protein MPNT_10175 [Candidatus Methylacidithermus pantelleriae]|uniref:Uncharacterized protein n=1 Tax=Candidatus Methylacidithermus pantelleriae TaxID=2744239 RepID=A0A8J2BQ41_9BACT|nr:hypothetical protein MPNT_10175 [Candidatus Methylacidithermus pantelleriae]
MYLRLRPGGDPLGFLRKPEGAGCQPKRGNSFVCGRDLAFGKEKGVAGVYRAGPSADLFRSLKRRPCRSGRHRDQRGSWHLGAREIGLGIL